MQCWWVNNTENWPIEIEEGYLYSGESRNPFRKNIMKMEVGDLVFCTHSERNERLIHALAIVREKSSGKLIERRSNRKWVTSKTAWPHGWEISLDYLTLESIEPWKPIWSDLKGSHRGEHFNDVRSGLEGYIFPLPLETAVAILRRLSQRNPQFSSLFPRVSGDSSMSAVVTEIMIEVAARVGHQSWATSVKRFWQNRCCVSGLDFVSLLRASHIVPWSIDPAARLDRDNGLSLAPAYDAAFDSLAITFDDNGSLRLSPELTETRVAQLGIDPYAVIVGLNPAHLAYLSRHRELFDKRVRARRG